MTLLREGCVGSISRREHAVLPRQEPTIKQLSYENAWLMPAQGRE